MNSYGPPEHVFVENEWYDGPRAGVANVGGRLHRFVSQWDEEADDYLGTFLVWPIEADEAALEQEQWQIFVHWNDQYEAGVVGSDSHPGHPGANKRWDEIASQLAAQRMSVPPFARRAKAQMLPLEQLPRYALSGPSYQLAWCFL